MSAADSPRSFLRTALLILSLLANALFGTYLWFDANVNPKPYSDDSLRIFLGAVQREDWATAASRVGRNDKAFAGRLQQDWEACTARHGPLTSYTVRGIFFSFTQAHATLTFADGTTAEWEVSMHPKSSPGWKLLYWLPPVCR